MKDDETRLNKYLATQLGISRREADNLIASGKVLINSEPIAIGARVRANDNITVNGKPLAGDTKLRYLAMHKPVGYVCSRRAQGDAPTIYELLPKEFHSLKTVGRLDRDSSGLILLTNDGDFTFHMTHPKFHKTKEYEVTLNRELEPLHQQMIGEFGVTLDDGVSRLGLARMSDDSRAHWRVTMQEGRNRQIRRTFQSLGYEVTNLHRIQFGNYSLGDIPEGEWTELTIPPVI